MPTSLLTEETENGVVVIRLSSDNPLNPLTDELVDALVSALERADADPGVRAVVLTGSAKAFAAGADVKAMVPLGYCDAFQQDYIGRNWDAVRKVRKPIVAAVRGYALGGGCELAMMCDIVLAAESAVFGQPEVALGIVPGAGGTQRLPRAVGKSLAMLMCLTGKSITAAEAQRAGLVAEVVPDDEVVRAAQQTAGAIARHSLPVVMAIKEAVNRSFESSLNEGLLFERRLFHAGFALHDQKEGIAAFTERRSPSFTDR
ncbi:enoyl-CoA hydratase-related protein [Streptomyces brasiliensis]|uniref:enoyl-CoA hydratase n=1 Tax=Streptomyces brasiliensis TaxID=1954 RepID=A0A917KBP8_9ACTN|nr:enoyl-CoA hydratase-related protein [Streptomyces brasiliensis]GGJ08054.1 enoyl-CoA hydratase [Streptomyces brasiliensis]